MVQKLGKAIIFIVSLFLGGSTIMFVGFYKGHDIAVSLSRPAGATGWTTSQELIFSCTYIPVIMGASLILLSILFSTVLFMKWINKTNH
ncbi:hypothetical protein [Geosporobacter ferrireducens]|uniref:Uncharacterized protein n=1 Tax=Geosporobacter ferrireducens TaxID=1424294 RepID=A0A1D8GPM9_9FIRM|nr:hypothetical protein [Geosporobacter ferrireducens]AOT72901.1 hypothetical protein Gferi_27090 [Geosporobacter ferrireducens]MTI55306.1 hypothetical protein [Geosporobacter ferrireducens]